MKNISSHDFDNEASNVIDKNSFFWTLNQIVIVRVPRGIVNY
jgi:hypothetical protein